MDRALLLALLLAAVAVFFLGRVVYELVQYGRLAALSLLVGAAFAVGAEVLRRRRGPTR